MSMCMGMGMGMVYTSNKREGEPNEPLYEPTLRLQHRGGLGEGPRDIPRGRQTQVSPDLLLELFHSFSYCLIQQGRYDSVFYR